MLDFAGVQPRALRPARWPSDGTIATCSSATSSATRRTTSGLVDDARPGRLLRRPGPRRGARRRAARDVRAGRVPRLDRRARRALDVPEVPVPAAGSAGRASSTARTRASTASGRSAGSTPRPGWPRRGPRRSTSGTSRRSRRRSTAGAQPGPPARCEPLGAAHRDALRRRADGRAGARPGDHLDRRAGRPDRDADRGRRHGRGAARHADPPLLDRRARDRHRRQPDRRARPTTTPRSRCRSTGRRAA